MEDLIKEALLELGQQPPFPQLGANGRPDPLRQIEFYLTVEDPQRVLSHLAQKLLEKGVQLPTNPIH